MAPSTGSRAKRRTAACSRTAAPSCRSTCARSRKTNYSWDIGLGWGRNQSNVDELAGAQFLLTDNGLDQDGRAGRLPARRDSQPGMGALRHQRRTTRSTASISRARAPASRRARCISTTARTTVRRQGHAVQDTDRAHHRQSESDVDRQRALELPLQEVGVLGPRRRQERRRRVERHARARCTATARTRTPRFARPAPAPSTVELHGQRARDRRVRLLSGCRRRPGRGRQVPGRRELVSQQRSRRVSVHGHRRSVHRGRRLREAARDLGRLHVRPAVGRALAGHEQRRAARRGSQPQDVDEVHGPRSRDDGRRRDRRALVGRTTSTCRSPARSWSPSVSTANDERISQMRKSSIAAAALCAGGCSAAATVFWIRRRRWPTRTRRRGVTRISCSSACWRTRSANQEGPVAMLICEWMQQCAGINGRFVDTQGSYTIDAATFDVPFQNIYQRRRT